MNWLLFPEPVGVPSRKPARPFQSFSNDGVSPWNPTVGVERVGVQRRHAGIEIERAARAFAQFRLPVVHQVVDEVEAEPDVVRALHPACIGVERVGLVVADTADSSPRDCRGLNTRTMYERRHAAFPRVGAVRARNAEHVQSEVGAEVGRLHVLAEPRPAERPVDQESRRDRVGLAHARDLHERVAVAERRRRTSIRPRPAPRLKSPVTSASMTLYLNHSWCRSLRFQLTLASMLLRFRRWVPELK